MIELPKLLADFEQRLQKLLAAEKERAAQQILDGFAKQRAKLLADCVYQKTQGFDIAVELFKELIARTGPVG